VHYDHVVLGGLTLLAILPVVVPSASVQTADPVTTRFRAWYRKFRVGKARYDARVLNPMLLRGNEADVKNLFRVLERKWKRRANGAPEGMQIQSMLLRALSQRSAAKSVRAALHGRFMVGIVPVEAPGDVVAWNHKEPELAARLIGPLTRIYGRQFRSTLENFCRGREPALIVASAEQLMRMRAGESFLSIGRGVQWLNEESHLRDLGRYLSSMASTDKVSQGQVDYIADIGARRLTTEADPLVKERLLQFLLELRSRRTVPFLISELDKTRGIMMGTRAYPTSTTFYLTAVNEALRDLTGFWGSASKPEGWKKWFETTQRTMQLKPKKLVPYANRGFFGIPVRGRHVLFLIDASDHMKGKAGVVNQATKMDRMREGLRRAVGELDPEARFNVMLYSEAVRRLESRPLGLRRDRLAKLDKMLNRVRAGGPPLLLSALQLGLEGRVRPTQTKTWRSVDEVFVLAAGSPVSEPYVILRKVGEWNLKRSARINAVFLGTVEKAMKTKREVKRGRSYGAVDFLQRLAVQNGGRFLVRQ
jgi:hypothetical protein